MINLLPEQTKRQLRAARTNTIIIKYLFTVLFATAFLGLLLGGSYYILLNSKSDAESAIVQVQKNNSSYSPVTTKTNEFNKDLTIAKKIIDQQVSYSKILEEFSKTLPKGTVLKSPFSISPKSLNSPLTFEVYATNSSDENNLKVNFEKNPIFSNYSMKSLNSNSGQPPYSYLITFNITINGAMLK